MTMSVLNLMLLTFIMKNFQALVLMCVTPVLGPVFAVVRCVAVYNVLQMFY